MQDGDILRRVYTDTVRERKRARAAGQQLSSDWEERVNHSVGDLPLDSLISIEDLLLQVNQCTTDADLRVRIDELCKEFHTLFREDISEQPADILPFVVDYDRAAWE
eukprot:gene2791-3617_t